MKNDDLLNAVEPVIIHGCNCFNTMGAGVARQIAMKYPTAWVADQKTKKGDKSKLGRYSYATGNDGKIIINAYTQFEYGRDKELIYYDALETVLHSICKDFDTTKYFAMPKIGCGLAGGDWDKVKSILKGVSTYYDKVFTVYYL